MLARARLACAHTHAHTSAHGDTDIYNMIYNIIYVNTQVSTLSKDYSHWRAVKSLHKWLEEQGIPGITGTYTVIYQLIYCDMSLTHCDIYHPERE